METGKNVKRGTLNVKRGRRYGMQDKKEKLELSNRAKYKI